MRELEQPDLDENRKHCERCGGLGEVQCPSCGGTGYSEDPRGLQPEGACAVCRGSGTVRCPRCSGIGRVGDFEFEVSGDDAREVERVAKALAEKGLKHMAKRTKIDISLHDSSIGVLNAGEIRNIESISVSVTALSSKGYSEVADALKALTESVTRSAEMSPRERTELLDNLEELSRQAALAEKKRAKPAVIKSILLGISTTLAGVGGLAEVWSTWGPTIQRFFGF